VSGASLFRREVVEARRGEWLGSIIIAAPLSHWPPTALAVLLAAAILLFLVFGHYTRLETVSRQLVPSTGLLNIVAPNVSTVTLPNGGTLSHSDDTNSGKVGVVQWLLTF